MKDLIAALLIISKYTDDDYNPTHCEHDHLYVTCTRKNEVTPEDLEELKRLGFHEGEYGFESYRFGAC